MSVFDHEGGDEEQRDAAPDLPNRKPVAGELAADKFHQQATENGWQPGDVVPHGKFESIIGMPLPSPNAPYQLGTRQRLAFANALEAMRRQLLERYQLDLQSVPGKGYRLVPAQEQVGLAQDDWHHKIAKANRKATRRIRNTDVTKLSHRERQEQADALAKIGRLRSMMRLKVN
ncbi:MAG: hypothetical protein ACYTFZ_00220 [Planctomycetota bacterium]|jgi:hypothetical protein